MRTFRGSKLEKSKNIRFNIDLYEQIKSEGKANNRSIGGQANWIYKVFITLKSQYPEIFSDIEANLKSKN